MTNCARAPRAAPVPIEKGYRLIPSTGLKPSRSSSMGARNCLSTTSFSGRATRLAARFAPRAPTPSMAPSPISTPAT
jgi:hypothetical protein